MRANLKDELCTVVTITVTPFTETGAIDDAAYQAVVRHVFDSGVRVLTPNGNTSEFYSLTVDEARHSLELTTALAADDGVVVAGVGHDVATATTMAAAASVAGAHAVMVHQPPHPYRSTEGWVWYHRAVAAAAPELGLVAYIRDPRITPEALVALAEACPTLVAIKYAVPDNFAMQKAIAAVGADRVAWICGLAERWAPFYWLAGAHGFTSGLASVAPALAMRLLDELRNESYADAMSTWRLLIPMEELRARHGDANNVSAIKEALAQLGFCRRDVRPPVSELDKAERGEVTELLQTWGLQP